MQVNQRSILLPHPIPQGRSDVELLRSRHPDPNTQTKVTSRPKGELLPAKKTTFSQRASLFTVGAQKSTPEFERPRADPRLIDIRPNSAIQSYQDTEELADGPASISQTRLDLFV